MRSPRPNGRPGGQQFREREGLHQVIIRAGIQSPHPVVDSARGRQHQYRGRRPAAAQRLDHLEPVDLRKHAIDDEQIPPLVYRDPQTIAAIILRGGLVSSLLQRAHYVLRGLGVVFDHEDSHRAVNRVATQRSCLQVCIFARVSRMLA